MKTLLFLLSWLAISPAIASIGDTPFTLAHSLSGLKCPHGQIYVTGMTQIVMYSSEAVGVAGIQNETEILSCNLNGNIKYSCDNVKKGHAFWIDKAQLQHLDTIKVIAKSGEHVGFEACISYLSPVSFFMNISNYSGPGKIEVAGTVIGAS